MVVVAAVASLVLVSCGGGNNASGPLKIGSLLPETGSLAFLGPPEFAGVDLAVEEINAAGGVLGENIEHTFVAIQEIQALILHNRQLIHISLLALVQLLAQPHQVFLSQ